MVPDSSSMVTVSDGKLMSHDSREHLADSHRATSQKPDNSFVVDLDAERGQTPREGHENKHRVAIKFSTKVRLASVRAYLEGKMDFDNSVLEGISKASSLNLSASALLTHRSDFLDHLLRETPSKSLINLRRSYFARNAVSEDRTLIGGGIEAMKGVYQSIRLAEVLDPFSMFTSCSLLILSLGQALGGQC